ncbi:hypothetical protein O3P69_019652 [Scylla paramamosain]|uniref:Uncharacterized protein n=1 Tax=Scylla paramamosain TaxID=85552 RepID=A0AAW0SYJ0_SCYPA
MMMMSPGSPPLTPDPWADTTAPPDTQLGLSFTVPFLSIPVGSLLSFGNSLTTSTTTALGSLMDINWPSVLFICVAVLAAVLLLPKDSYLDPVTSIVTQIEEALAQYDLDASSCVQRGVCTFMSSSGARVREGKADSTSLLAVGLAKYGSKWLEEIIGENSITKAVKFGQEKNQDCSLQYPECPVSLPDIVRGLMSVVT